MSLTLGAGLPDRLGAVLSVNGVNFAVFSAHSTQIDLCLFDSGAERQVPLPGRTGDVWHGFVPDIGAGQAYGFRAHGPWAPTEGHLFNPAKLLIDPYARAIDRRIVWHPSMTGTLGDMPDPVDSAAHVPKSIVLPDTVPQPAAHITTPHLIWEGHVKGLTQRLGPVPDDLRGTFGALSHPALVNHMQAIGVSHLELLPIAAFIDDRHVHERGLTNYWGYQPIAFFAPEPRYQGGADIAESVRKLAAGGIGVILDVVFNHTGEGDSAGPTLCYRGLDNKSYYRLGADGTNLNDAGTGNTLNLAQPMVLRLVLDALRHWAGQGVAGFRFDLATTLLRDGSGFLQAVRDDPLLAGLILIAEPWDMGPDGYRLGRFPTPWHEWNDRFRDDVRRFWRGDGRAGDLARRLTGSAELFEPAGRGAASAVNYLAAHDGMTLADVVSYRDRHNWANGEENHDGHGENCSDNLGVEGASRDPVIVGARHRRVRAMLATLFLSQGTPMLLAGDEFGRSQAGNNNAYAQDTALSWLDWGGADTDLIGFVARLAALRQTCPALQQPEFLHGNRRPDGTCDLVWRLASGGEPASADWDNPDLRLIGMELRGRDPTENGALYAVFNCGGAAEIALPDGTWLWELDTANPTQVPSRCSGTLAISGQSVHLFKSVGLADQVR